jgi:hypothetical protein
MSAHDPSGSQQISVDNCGPQGAALYLLDGAVGRWGVSASAGTLIMSVRVRMPAESGTLNKPMPANHLAGTSTVCDHAPPGWPGSG